MSSIMDRLKKNSKIKDASILSESKFFLESEQVPTDIPMMNVALSGRLDGGLSPGMTVFAGDSKHFKSMYSLLLAAAYLKKYPEGVLLFYDSEFGSPQKYFENLDIPMDRVLHTPVTDVEELKFDLMSQVADIDRDNDKVIIIIDSVGNLASKKEVEDAMNEKSVADMTRAKSLKSLFRMVTPHLTTKQIPLIVVNHVYRTMELYSKAIVSGGTGVTYASNTVFIVGRQQEKVGTDITGYNFVLNVEKSRFVKEKAKIPITVTWDKGVEKYSGLLEVALLGGFVTKPSQGWYCRIDSETGEEVQPKRRLKDTMTAEFWDPLLNDPKFRKFVEEQYMIGYRSIINFDDAVFDSGVEEADAQPAEV